jgi:hypothetical protein
LLPLRHQRNPVSGRKRLRVPRSLFRPLSSRSNHVCAMISGSTPAMAGLGPLRGDLGGQVHLVCTDATGENFLFATENEAFIRSNSWTESVDSALQTHQMNTGILFLEFGPKYNTLGISTADAAVHAYNPAIDESLRTLIPARSVPWFCVSPRHCPASMRNQIFFWLTTRQ